MRRISFALLCALGLLFVDSSSDARPGALRRIFGRSFSPASIAGLTLWLEADSGIVLNGSNVSQWTDKSGNGANASQATAGSQPVYTASGGPNGLAYLSGVGRFLTGSSQLWSSPANFAICVVAYSRTDLGGQPIIYAGNWGGSASAWNGAGLGLIVDSIHPLELEAFTPGGAVYGYPSVNPSNNAWHTICANQNGSGSSSFRIDGSPVATANNIAGSVTPSPVFQIGQDQTYTNMPATAAILVYSSALNLTQLSQIESYLRAKYATW